LVRVLAPRSPLAPPRIVMVCFYSGAFSPPVCLTLRRFTFVTFSVSSQPLFYLVDRGVAEATVWRSRGSAFQPLPVTSPPPRWYLDTSGRWFGPMPKWLPVGLARHLPLAVYTPVHVPGRIPFNHLPLFPSQPRLIPRWLWRVHLRFFLRRSFLPLPPTPVQSFFYDCTAPLSE